MFIYDLKFFTNLYYCTELPFHISLDQTSVAPARNSAYFERLTKQGRLNYWDKTDCKLSVDESSTRDMAAMTTAALVDII